MARFVSTHVSTGETIVHNYANVKNVFRFGLRKDSVPAGQFEIREVTDTVTGQTGPVLLTAYRQV